MHDSKKKRTFATELQSTTGTTFYRHNKIQISLYNPTKILNQNMKNILILICAVFCSMQAVALNLVIEHRSGGDLLQDIAIIGKWVFVDNSLQLQDKSGSILATESIPNIKKIIFSASDASVEIEEIPSNTILVYPNPTQDVLMIKGIEDQRLRVYDLQGRLLSTSIGTQVEVKHLANGTYLLQVGTQIVRFIKHE